MTVVIIIALLWLLNCSLYSAAYTVRQDGTGDFTAISEGIAAAQHGDTLIVYPGIYYENINFQGKNITITSLYQPGGDENIISETVIDGNAAGTVVTFDQNESRNAILSGFTIRNGKIENMDWQYYGGGIHLAGNSSPVIQYCIIEDNISKSGAGGILAKENANPLLKRNVIRCNKSLRAGGGVIIFDYGDLEFSADELNSIYLNYAGWTGSDIHITSRAQSAIIIDTLTVADPCRFFFTFIYDRVPDDFSLTVKNGKIVPIDADLYISPGGCDGNSGLTPEEPLKTFVHAMIHIASNPDNPRTVHVAEGIYSSSLNGQFFPVRIRDNVNIIGVDKESTILDAEHESWHFSAVTSFDYYPDNIPDFVRNFRLENFTLINGGAQQFQTIRTSLFMYFASDFVLKNIDIIEPHSRGHSAVSCHYGDKIYIQDLAIVNSRGFRAMSIGTGLGLDKFRFYAENVRILKSVPEDYYSTLNCGGGLAVTGPALSGYPPEGFVCVLANWEITDCIMDNTDPEWLLTVRGSAVQITDAYVRMINCTIGNNTVVAGPNIGAVSLKWSSILEIYNSIIYGNTPHQIVIADPHPYYTYYPNILSVEHSLIENGLDGIHNLSDLNIVNWGEGNIDTDPLWMGELDSLYPYMLSESSPAINAGTLDIDDFAFPEYDLAGNPRIFGNSIDIGAYEWNPFLNIDTPEENVYQVTKDDYKLHNFPNPATGLRSVRGGGRKGMGTTISFELPEPAQVDLTIYNLKGQFVRKVFNAFASPGEYEAFWDGTDEQGRVVSTGFYLYKLQLDGETVATGRCTFIK